MKAPKLLSQALRTMGRYRLRSILMILGIVVGIASLTVLSSIGEATKRETMQRFKNMIGTFDTIIVRPGGGRSRGMPTLVNVPFLPHCDSKMPMRSQETCPKSGPWPRCKLHSTWISNTGSTRHLPR